MTRAMTDVTFEMRSLAEGHELPISAVEPFNLRLTHQPLRCLTGVTIPPGLVGFCWETPLSLEVLAQQAPDLAEVARRWIDTSRPIFEQPWNSGEHRAGEHRAGEHQAGEYRAREPLSADRR